MKTCQEITESIEKGNVAKLSIRERLAIRLHLRMCPPCKHYAKDSAILERLLRLQTKKMKEYSFTPEEKSRLKERLK